MLKMSDEAEATHKALLNRKYEDLESITSFELEAQSASILKVTAERVISGTHTGKIKLVVGTQSVVLSAVQAKNLGQKLFTLSGPSGKVWSDETT